MGFVIDMRRRTGRRLSKCTNRGAGGSCRGGSRDAARDGPSSLVEPAISSPRATLGAVATRWEGAAQRPGGAGPTPKARGADVGTRGEGGLVRSSKDVGNHVPAQIREAEVASVVFESRRCYWSTPMSC